MFGKHQRSASRAVKSLTKVPSVPPSTLSPLLPPKSRAKLLKWRREVVAERTKGKPGYQPMEAIDARLKNTLAAPGFASMLLLNLRAAPEQGLPHTVQFAEGLDHLAQDLIVRQWPGEKRSLDDYKRALTESPLVLREFWINPANQLDALPAFEQATAWPDVLALSHIALFHLQISLLALWDAEYCAEAFVPFRPIPLFLNLAPRLRPRPGEQPIAGLQRLNNRAADMIDGPFSQLVDLLWCLLHYVRHTNWPPAFPTLDEMAEDLNNYKGDLAQLRVGNPNLTADLFYALWPDTLRNDAGELMVPPLALLAAAHLWDLISPRERPIIPVDYCYMRAWHRHRFALGASQSQTSPTIDWPPYLNRGLEIPASG